MVDGSGTPGDESAPGGAERGGALVVPGLTVQRQTAPEALLAQLIGTLEIDSATNCLVVRIAVGTAAGTGDGLVDIDVAWPPGWSLAIRDGEIALIDAAGQTAGRLGDEVWVGGGSVDAARANVVSCTGATDVFLASGLSGP
jgi:hypothetical protein